MPDPGAAYPSPSDVDRYEKVARKVTIVLAAALLTGFALTVAVYAVYLSL